MTYRSKLVAVDSHEDRNEVMISTNIDDGSNPARHYIFASIFYLVGIAILIGLCQGRAGNWKGGMPASLATHVLFIAACFCWGTVSLGSGLRWSFVTAHGDVIDDVVLGLLLVVSAYDRFIHWRDH